MSRMIRKQIYIEPRQEEILKRLSRELGVSEAELIRRGIDQLDNGAEKEARRRRAWEEAKAFMEERLQMQVPQTGRDWTREELYEERFERYSDRHEHSRLRP